MNIPPREGLHDPHGIVRNLGTLDRPQNSVGHSIPIPSKLISIDQYGPNDQILLAGLMGEGTETSASYTFSSRLGEMDMAASFAPAANGIQGTLEIDQVTMGVEGLDEPRRLGSITGILPMGGYHVNDFYRDEIGEFALDFGIGPEGIFVKQDAQEVLLDPSDPDYADVRTILLTAAFNQAVLSKITPEIRTGSPKNFPDLEWERALQLFNHGAFLRLHKGKPI